MFVFYVTRVCWILNIQSVRHAIRLLNITATIPHADACPLVVEVQSIQFKELQKHHTIVQFVRSVWRQPSFTSTVKLQAKQSCLSQKLSSNVTIPPHKNTYMAEINHHHPHPHPHHHHLIRPHTKIKIWQFKWTSEEHERQGYGTLTAACN